MTDEPPVVLEHREAGIAWISLNRPDRMNAVTPQLYEALGPVIRAAALDSEVKCVVLTGEGRAFCAGRDLKAGPAWVSDSPGDWLERRVDYLQRHAEIARSLHEMPKPTIAMINGACAGAGLSLAGACDIRVASHEAVFTSAFVRAGLSGDMGGIWFWTKILGAGKARRLYLLSERFDAPAAEAYGLVDRIVDAGALRNAVESIAGEFVAGSSRALRYAKAALNAAEDSHLEAILEMEAMSMAMAGVDAAAGAGEIAQRSAN